MGKRCLGLMALVLAFGASAGVPEGVEAFNKQRYAEARKELADLAQQGDAEAMVVMGQMLMRGQGGPRDELKARDYVLKAQEAGSVRASYVLGMMYLTGNLIKKDETKAVELVQSAAQQRFPMAEATWGAWIAKGLFGQEKNEAVALTWFQAAAEHDDALAMNWLGDFFEYGRGGVVADLLVALDWYKKAAERGNGYAMTAAGRMYALGRGVASDGNEALRWLRKAVAAGNPLGYVWTGSVYEFGRGGVARSLPQAYAWYLATPGTVNADPVTRQLLADGKERVMKQMSAAEQEEGVKLSRIVVSQAVSSELIANVAKPTAQTARKTMSGSGVVVSPRGEVLTNAHVVQGCERIRVQPTGGDVKVAAKDEKNDLALLRGDGLTLPPIRLRAGRGVRLGDNLTAVGYPLRGVLSSGPVVTTGIVNALSGYSDDTSGFQMSATVQPGSSGGPIVDGYGALVGIVRARLMPTGVVAPQNVNFGINLATVMGFLDAHSVDYLVGTAGAKLPALADVIAQVQKSTIQVECY